jgi:hypothetical protein
MKKGAEYTEPNAQRILLNARLIASIKDIGSLSALLPEVLNPSNAQLVREIIRGLRTRMGMEDVVSTIREVEEQIVALLQLGADRRSNSCANPGIRANTSKHNPKTPICEM